MARSGNSVTTSRVLPLLPGNRSAGYQCRFPGSCANLPLPRIPKLIRIHGLKPYQNEEAKTNRRKNGALQIKKTKAAHGTPATNTSHPYT